MPLGSPTLESYLDLVKAGKVLVLFPHTGSSLFRHADLKYIINFRASYASEGEALARYAIETLNAKKIVLFYQKDVESIDGVLKFSRNLDLLIIVKLCMLLRKRISNGKFSRSIKLKPIPLYFYPLTSTTLELMRQIGIHNLIGKNLLGWSDLLSETVQNYSRSHGLKIILSSVVPSPHTSMLPIVKKYRELAMQKNLLKMGILWRVI